LPVIDQLAELADLGSGVFGPPQELHRAQRHFRGVIFLLDTVPAAFLAQVLAEELVGVRMQDPHVQCVPLHLHGPPDPPGWQAVIGRLDFDATVQMHHALSVLVVTEGLERQREQVRFFFREHGRDLTFGRAMDARVGPALFPAIQIRLRLFQALETHSLEWRFLRVADPRLHFPLAIGIFDPARQRHHAVVSKHIAKQWIDGGIVDVGNQHAFFQVVENHNSGTTT
jgi:hypothetical protein